MGSQSRFEFYTFWKDAYFRKFPPLIPFTYALYDGFCMRTGIFCVHAFSSMWFKVMFCTHSLPLKHRRQQHQLNSEVGSAFMQDCFSKFFFRNCILFFASNSAKVIIFVICLEICKHNCSDCDLNSIPSYASQRENCRPFSDVYPV